MPRNKDFISDDEAKKLRDDDFIGKCLEEFDEKFVTLADLIVRKGYLGTRKEIKSFIHQKLLEAKEKLASEYARGFDAGGHTVGGTGRVMYEQGYKEGVKEGEGTKNGVQRYQMGYADGRIDLIEELEKKCEIMKYKIYCDGIEQELIEPSMIGYTEGLTDLQTFLKTIKL